MRDTEHPRAQARCPGRGSFSNGPFASSGPESFFWLSNCPRSGPRPPPGKLFCGLFREGKKNFPPPPKVFCQKWAPLGVPPNRKRARGPREWGPAIMMPALASCLNDEVSADAENRRLQSHAHELGQGAETTDTSLARCWLSRNLSSTSRHIAASCGPMPMPATLRHCGGNVPRVHFAAP